MGKLNLDPKWSEVNAGIRAMLDIYEIKESIPAEHIQDTPERFVKAFKEYFEGCGQDPKSVLEKSFNNDKYDQMVFQNDIPFISHCAHHLAPFVGKVHFAYIPDKTIVGLSKMARLVDILAHRPQIQERLSRQIVDIFGEEVKPLGCGVVIEAFHFCICARGVKKTGSYTRTSALYGNFMQETTRGEFLLGAVSKEEGLI